LIGATLAHAAVLAELHAAAFPTGEQWNARAFGDMLAMPGAFGFIDERGGFIMARVAGGEAEILTLAVAPSSRRQGIARELVSAVVGAVPDVPVFLEVAANNEPAQCLYRGAGFTACGRRRDYYGPGRDAIVLRR
jgi:ribosomal-protein-alanine N-acetyltransferase